MQDVSGLRGYAQLRDSAVTRGGQLYAGKETLIAMKAAAGRPEDRRDIAELDARPASP